MIRTSLLAALVLASHTAQAKPGLGGATATLDVSSIDPQIAASREAVIVTQYDTAYLLDRSLKPAGTINLYDVFAPTSSATRILALSFVAVRERIFHELGIGLVSPALEVTSNDTIVITYRKLGRGLTGFGARFLFWTLAGAPEGRALAEDSIQDPDPSPRTATSTRRVGSTPSESVGRPMIAST